MHDRSQLNQFYGTKPFLLDKWGGRGSALHMGV